MAHIVHSELWILPEGSDDGIYGDFVILRHLKQFAGLFIHHNLLWIYLVRTNSVSDALDIFDLE